METWVKLVAVSHGLGAVLTLGMGVVFAVFAVTLSEPAEQLLGMILSILVLAVGALQTAITVGLWRHRPWARIGAITFAILLLFTGGGSLPAIVALIVLFHPKGRALFYSPATDTTPGIEASVTSLD